MHPPRPYLIAETGVQVRLSSALDMGATVLLCVVAVVVLVRGRPEGATGTPAAPQNLDDWRRISASGLWVGSRNAPVTITEFVDFQCPFCAQLEPTLDSVLEQNSPRVALSMQHDPLGIHPQAVRAAVAVECADRQGRADVYVPALFRAQSTFAQRPWVDVARAVSMPNLREFKRCITLPTDSFPRIHSGQETASKYGVYGTPSIWVNGVRASRSTLGRQVKDALAKASKRHWW